MVVKASWQPGPVAKTGFSAIVSKVSVHLWLALQNKGEREYSRKSWFRIPENLQAIV